MKSTYEIGYPCSPSQNISQDRIKATEILVTWGGGMGGASKRYYALKKNGNELHLLNGDIIKLNPNFIVHEKEVNIVKVVTDTTEHSNFRKHTVNSSIVTQYILLKFGEIATFVDDYKSADNERIILRHLDKS